MQKRRVKVEIYAESKIEQAISEGRLKAFLNQMERETKEFPHVKIKVKIT